MDKYFVVDLLDAVVAVVELELKMSQLVLIVVVEDVDRIYKNSQMNEDDVVEDYLMLMLKENHD